MMKPFELLEHTADVALLACGRDLGELIANAAAGLIAVLFAAEPPPAEQWLEREVQADSADLLVHHALRELLYLLEDEGLAPVTVTVMAVSETACALRMGVIPRETAEPLLGGPVKAVTRHGLGIGREGEWLTARIVFDV